MELTETERQMLDLLKGRASDSRIRAELVLDQRRALEVADSLRSKLGAGPAETIREAARRLGL